MRAGGSATTVRIGASPSTTRLLVVAILVAIGAGVVAATSTSPAISWTAFGVASALAMSAILGLATVALTRRALRSLARSAAEVGAGGPRRIAGAGGDLDAVGTLINRMADDAQRTLGELRGERDLLGSVLDSMTQGVIALDGDRRITLINPAARRIFALPGVPIGERFADQITVPEALALVDAMRADATAEFTTAGSVRALARVTAQRSGEGHLLVLDDVTAIRRLETIRRDFVANVSHELRTPVSVIRANAETLQAGGKDDPAFAGRLVDGLHRNAERLARIVADLLDLSRLDAGHYRLDRTALPLGVAVGLASSAVEALASARQATIVSEIPPDAIVQADPKALDQVLVNLLDNAVKYSPIGGRVVVRIRPRGALLRVEITDEGPGIAADHRDRIFERFYRVDPGRSRDVGGTGLGLSIAKHLIETMGGTVGVDANHPTGSVFWFELSRE